MDFIRRHVEIRAEGRRLTGTAMVYGDTSPSHRERFEPGSISMAGAVTLNLQHRPREALAWYPGGGLELTDNRDRARLELRAELPPIPAADAALDAVRRGELSGLSVEFRAMAERMDGNIRVIERAELSGVGLVRNPSYPQSTVEARARSGRTLRARIPYDQNLACECIAQRGPGSGGACIPEVKFAKMAGDAMAELMNDASRDVLAVFKDYSRPLGSARKGTVRAVSGDDGLDIEVDLPSGEAGDMAVAASESAGVIVRPLIDYDRMEAGTDYQDGPDGRTVRKPFVRAFLVGATDDRAGWTDAKISYDDDDIRHAEPRRWRTWL